MRPIGLTKFNNTMVGQPTPAGQALMNNGLFTLAQLQALGGVIGGNATGGFSPLSLAPHKPTAVHLDEGL